MIHVDVTIRNPADKSRSWQGRFLVAASAMDSVAPRRHLEALGIEPHGQRVYELADGAQTRMDIGGARIEFLGVLTHADVIFGNDDAEPILGMTALQSAGIEIDPRNQRLNKLPSVRLKRSYRQAFLDSTGNQMRTNL